MQPYGYPLEAHTVETVDGYLLGVFRMPRGADADAPVTHRCRFAKIPPWKVVDSRDATLSP